MHAKTKYKFVGYFLTTNAIDLSNSKVENDVFDWFVCSRVRNIKGFLVIEWGHSVTKVDMKML